MKAYGDDLAYIHDVGFGWFARESAPGVLGMLRRAGIRGGRVVDLGCGSGLWAADLVRAGYGVVGVDISAAMIRIARQRVPEGEFHVGSYLDFELPPCDAVTSLGECFNYLFDEANSRQRLARLFRRVYHALKPGGQFIFDVATPGRGYGPTSKHACGPDWAVLVEIEEDAKRRRLTRRITSFRKVGRHYRRDEETHHLRLYEPSELAADLRKIGFRVRTVRGYGEHRFPKGYVGFVARKA